MEQLIQCFVSKKAYATKPDGDEIATVLSGYDAFDYKELSVRDLFNDLTNGHSIRPCLPTSRNISRGNFNDNDIQAIQVLELDFDDIELSPEQLVRHCQTLDMEPNFWHYSFNNGREPNKYRYRAVWCFDSQVPKEYWRNFYRKVQYIYENLASSDPACLNPSRLWHGTNKGGAIINENLISIKDGGWQPIYLQLLKDGPNADTTIRRARMKADNDYSESQHDAEVVKVKANWMEELYNAHICDIFDRLYQGEYITCNEFVALVGNIKYLKASTNKTPYQIKNQFKALLDKYPNTWAYDSKSRPGTRGYASNDNIDRIWKDKKIVPYNICRWFGKYMTIAEWFDSKEIIRDHIDLTKSEKVEPLNGGEIMETQKVLTYIQAPVGSGKTRGMREHIIKEMNLSFERIIYAVPRHNLAKEVYEDFVEEARKSNPEQEQYIHYRGSRNYTQEDMNRLYLGLPAKSKNTDKNSVEVYKMLASNDITERANGLFIITHELLLMLPIEELGLTHIIVDENIEEALIDKFEASYEQLERLTPYMLEVYRASYTKWVEQIKSHVGINEKVSMWGFGQSLTKFDYDAYMKNEKTPIKNLARAWRYADGFTRGRGRQRLHPEYDDTLVSFLPSNFLSQGAHITLLTASPCPSYIKLMFPNIEFFVHKQDFQQPKSDVICFVGTSGSHANIDDAIKYAEQLIDEGKIPYSKEELTTFTHKLSYKKVHDAGFTIAKDDDETNVHI